MHLRRYAPSYPGATPVPMADPTEPEPIVNTNTGGVKYVDFDPVVQTVTPAPAPAPVTTIYNTIEVTSFPSNHVFPTTYETPAPLDTTFNNGLLAPPAFQNEEETYYVPAGEVSGGGTDASQWAVYRAVQAVDMSANDINNIDTIRGISETTPIIVASPLQIIDISSNLPELIGHSISTITNTIADGDAIGLDIASIGATEVNGSAVGLAIASSYANNTGGIARGIYIQDIQAPTTIGIDLAGGNTGTTARGIYEHHTSANVINTFMHNVGIGKDPSGVALDVSGNANITGTLDMVGNNIIKVNNISAIDASGVNAGINIQAPYQNGLSDPGLTIEGADNRTDISNNAFNVVIKKNIRSGTNDEGITQLNFYGKVSTGADAQYGFINQTATNSTAGAATGQMIFRTRRNNLQETYLVLDGSNNVVDVGTHKIVNVVAPTANTDAANKAYVDSASTGGGSAWSSYPATQTVDISGYTLDNVTTIASLDASGSQIIFDTPAILGTGVSPVANLLVLGGANRTDISNAGVNITTRKVISGGGNGETIGQYNFSGLTSTGVTRIYGQLVTQADSILNGSEQSRVSLFARRLGGNVPFVVCDGSNNTVIMERGITLGGTGDRGIEECGFIGNTGSIDISAVGVSSDITISAGDDITIAANDVFSMTTGGTMSLTGSDLNLNCTGALSVLNINSVLGTLLASVGAIDITAGGTTAINSTGNVTIGSLGTTSIENFNLNNSVLTKVAATPNLELNDIGTLNSTTEGSLIDSKATLQVSLTTSTGAAVGFQAQGVSSSADDAAGLLASNVTTSFTGGNAYGVFVTNAIATDGAATGIKVEEITGTNAGTGIEIAGNIVGTTKRGFYEHSAGAGIMNTFMNPVGIGHDPSGVFALDVSGQTNIIAAVGGRANPTLSLTSTSAAAPGAYLQFYHNSATPDVGDRAGVMDFYGNNASAIKKEYARIRTLQDGNVNGAEKGTIEMSVVTNGSMTTYFDVDGSNNGVVINPDKAVVGSFKMYDSVGVATNNTLINADAIAGNVMLKNYPQQYVYDIAGSYTLTMPTGFNVMRVLMFGAGGGGGSGRKGAVGTACAGGGGGGGGNGGELWFSRRELFPDTSGSMTFYVFVGAGGAGGAAVTADDTNGNNGAAGGATSMNLVNSFFVSMLYYQMSGGNGGSGGTATTGTGGGGASFSGSGNVGSSGRGGGTSTITGQPDRVLSGVGYCGTMFNSTGGSGAGGGMSAANVAFPGGIFVSPAGQKWNGLGANVSKNGAASAVGNGGNGSVVTFDAVPNAAVKPFSGGCDMAAGGGASSAVNFSGGAGGEIPAGTAGGRGSGGGGGGAARNGTGTSGKGGKGADGLVYVTFW